MARDFWGDIEESNGDYETPKFELLPDGERVQANILKAEWKTVTDYKSQVDDEVINLQIEVESGDYKGRMLFGSLKVHNPDNKRAERDKKMLAAIDFNVGSKLRALKREPTDDDLQKYLVNKSMVFVIGLMANGGKYGKGMNYLQGVSSSKPSHRTNKIVETSEDVDGDIPF